jgi:hypothetical protein
MSTTLGFDDDAVAVFVDRAVTEFLCCLSSQFLLLPGCFALKVHASEVQSACQNDGGGYPRALKAKSTDFVRATVGS